MKNYVLSFAFFLSVNFAQSAILRCNNNPTVTGVYTTAQDAHDAANPGDTIHLEPTTFGSYGDLNVNKHIVLISTGDFLNQNQGFQASLTPGSCDNINLNAGSENSVVSVKASNISISANNIFITHCHFNGISIYNPTNALSNILISNNIGGGITLSSPSSTIIITNNYLHGLNLNNAQSSAVISYNIIYHGSYAGVDVSNSTLSNNIFIGSNYWGPINFTNCMLSDNIDEADNLPSGNNNVNNVDMSTVFAHWGNFDGDNYQLLPGSPYQNVGMFAGSNPYKLATTPAVPSIYHLNVPGTSSGNNLNFSVSTRSNN